MSRGEILKLSDLKDMHGSITLEYTGILYAGVDNKGFNPYKTADTIKEQLKVNDVMVQFWQEISDTAYNSYNYE